MLKSDSELVLLSVQHLSGVHLLYIATPCRNITVTVCIPAVTAQRLQCDNATKTNSFYRLLATILLDFDSWIVDLQTKAFFLLYSFATVKAVAILQNRS